MAPGFPWPTDEEAREIHARLCQGDPVASSELAMAFLEPLAVGLLRGNPHVDPHLCEQAAEDAILTLIEDPDSYDPDRGRLGAYLKMSARGDLKNALDRERRLHSRIEYLEEIELSDFGRNSYQEGTDPATIVERENDERELLTRVVAPEVEHSFTREEQCVLALMLKGERRTSEYARILGITELPEIDQRRAVKRAKDRIKRRMQRRRDTL